MVLCRDPHGITTFDGSLMGEISGDVLDGEGLVDTCRFSSSEGTVYPEAVDILDKLGIYPRTDASIIMASNGISDPRRSCYLRPKYLPPW